MNIRFLKEPGYTYDLFFLFTLYFNKQYFKTSVNTIDDFQYYENLLERYLPISEELLLFFHINGSDRNLMLERYFQPYKGDFADENYNLEKVLVELADYDKVVDNVIRFYFRGISAEKTVDCKKSILAINKMIKESKYDFEIKSALYSFFIEPIPIIQKLIYELISKEILMAQLYKKEDKNILHLQESFDCERLSPLLELAKNQPQEIDSFEKIYISFCVQYKDLISCYFDGNTVIMIIGINYIDTLDFLTNRDSLPELDVFGTAVSEKNRVEILNLMTDMGEVTIKDIEQKLGFTGTNAYYHLMLMMKTGMLETRNQGRTVFYRIHKEYFIKLCKAIKKYAV